MHASLDGRGLGRRNIREEMADGTVGCTGGLPDCLRDVLPCSSAERAGYLDKAGHFRTYYTDHFIYLFRLRRIGHEMIKTVGKSESCMVSALPIILRRSRICWARNPASTFDRNLRTICWLTYIHIQASSRIIVL